MMVQSSQRSHIMSNGLLLLALFLALFIWQLRTKKRQAAMNIINNDGLKVYDILLAIGFNPMIAKYITAQAAHESANFTSFIYKNNNNCFGMKYVGQKLATEKNGYANYKTIEDCIADYKGYFQRRSFGTFDKVSTFVESLKAVNYFEAPVEEYKAGVTYFYTLYFGND